MIPKKIIFINQYAGPLFRELAEDLAKFFGTGDLFSGHIDEFNHEIYPDLNIIESPKQRTNNSIRRIFSWLQYLIFIFPKLWRNRKKNLLFIVSNPPILPWIGYLSKLLWNQRYVVLIYDLFPDMLIQFSRLPENGLIARAWRFLNKVALENAEIVFTIGEYMAAKINAMYDAKKTTLKETMVISNWADPDAIFPIDKAKNWFAQKHQQTDKLTILYSGTIGIKHNIVPMIKAAIQLRTLEDIHFLFIGRGEGYNYIQETIKKERLTNTTLLPLQPESDLPFSLATGDIAVIALDRGGEGVYVPSKTYYALASGSALIAICGKENELADLVQSHKCGIVVDPSDPKAFVEAVRKYYKDRSFLETCRANARQVVITQFNRNNCTQKYIEALKRIQI